MKVAATVLAMLAVAAPALAATPRTTLPAVEDQVMCVTCGIPLAEADSPQADRERAFISSLIAQGQTLSQVKASLVAQYGPSVLSMPHDSGFNIVVYAIPVALVLLAAGGLAVALPRWRRRATEDPTPPPPLSPQDAARLDAELGSTSNPAR